MAKVTEGIEPPDPQFAKEAVDLFEQIVPLLRGRHPYVQGLVLADCLALWLAGHATNDPEQTEKLRADLLRNHVAAVKDLVGPNVQMLMERARAAANKPN